MTETASTELSAETANFATVETPKELSYEWNPRGRKIGEALQPPPPELKRFVRSLSVLGVPVNEIARRVKDRIGAKSFHVHSLYRYFGEELLTRMKRGKRGVGRVRLIEKPPGWKPMLQGSPFSYADVLAILQSDLDSRDLARLYGVGDYIIYKLRRGESRLTQHLLPRIMLTQENVSPKDMAFRAEFTADMAVKLVEQLRRMISISYGMIADGKLPDPMGALAPPPPEDCVKMYRVNPENGGVEERNVKLGFEEKAAHASGWRKDKPK